MGLGLPMPTCSRVHGYWYVTSQKIRLLLWWLWSLSGSALGVSRRGFPLQDHDAVLAAISHFPHLLAYGLASMLAHTPMGGLAQTLHGGGLRDTTRIAASSATLWADILLDNREELLPLMGTWAQSFGQLSKSLVDSDRARLIALLEDAARWRRGF